MTCDAHFWTRTCYSSQKSCVKNFGLDWLKSEVCIFRGGRNPLLGGLHVTSDAQLRTWQSYSSQKSCVKIWFGLVEPFKSYRVHKHPKKKKKKKITDTTENNIRPFFGRIIIIIIIINFLECRLAVQRTIR